VAKVSSPQAIDMDRLCLLPSRVFPQIVGLAGASPSRESTFNSLPPKSETAPSAGLSWPMAGNFDGEHIKCRTAWRRRNTAQDGDGRKMNANFFVLHSARFFASGVLT